MQNILKQLVQQLKYERKQKAETVFRTLTQSNETNDTLPPCCHDGSGTL